LLKQQIISAEPNVTGNNGDFNKDLETLANKLFGKNLKAKTRYVSSLLDMFQGAEQKDFLVIHSPGGWGNSEWDEVQDWEKSIVTGVTSTLRASGYSYYVTQYLRGVKRRWGHIADISKDLRFFSTGNNRRAQMLAPGLNLIASYLPKTNIILVAASQGAAFDNAVMREVGNIDNIYSIELGTFFPYMKHRKLTDRTLVIDSNGIMRDPMCERDLGKGAKAYFKAFGKWLRFRIAGKKVKFTQCINTPGHEYNWDFPAVHTNITNFLKTKFANKN
jgi:hypothetical protein